MAKCCIKFKADGSVAARQCIESATTCPEGWVTLTVPDPKDCPPYPVGATPTGAVPGGGTIQSADDLRFKEWQECRTTIARLDTVLEDLRKVGFSIPVTLLTASTLFGLLGFPGTTGAPLMPPSL